MEKFVNQEGCKVAYDYLAGNRAITIILVHGYGLYRAMWQPQVTFLQESGYAVINIDVRGHGNSRPASEFSVKLAAEDIHAILNSEKPGQYLLCGLSMGAFVVQEYAFLFGGRWVYADRGDAVIYTLPQMGKDTARILRGNDEVSLHLEGAEKAMAKGSTYTKPALLRVGQMFEEIDKQEFLVSWQGFTTCLHEELFKYNVPLLVVAGEQDTRGTIQKHLPDWQKHYPGCAVKTIANAGHVANLDQPEQFNRILFSFYKSL